MRLPALFELLAIVLEHMRFETFERHTLEISRRNDAIGVDVVAAQRNCSPRDFVYEA
jgi:hypothetical protein